MKIALLMVFCFLLLVGCAAFRATIDEIKQDPDSFKQESGVISATANAIYPGLPPIAYGAIGYGLAFLRRWYKNRRIKQAKTEIV